MASLYSRLAIIINTGSGDNYNKRMSQEVKKKKVYKKVDKNDTANSSIQGSFADRTMTDPEVSSIRPPSQPPSHLNSALLGSSSLNLSQKALSVVQPGMVSLHHDGNFADLKA
jgi:hypothetical protein